MSSKPERKPGRNDPCWCGSGKKYKNCHLPGRRLGESRHGDARYSSGIPIGKLPLRSKQHLLYVFDFGNQHEFDIQWIETRPELMRDPDPRLVEQHGKMPPHYSNWDGASEEEDDGEKADEANAL